MPPCDGGSVRGNGCHTQELLAVVPQEEEVACDHPCLVVAGNCRLVGILKGEKREEVDLY